jgi:hypothetical protein
MAGTVARRICAILLAFVVLSGSSSAQLAIADPVVVVQDDHGQQINGIAYVSALGLMATTHADSVTLWKVAGGIVLRPFFARGIGHFSAVALSRDGQLLVAIGWERPQGIYVPVLAAWETSSGALRHRVPLPEAQPAAGHLFETDVNLVLDDGHVRIDRLDRVLDVDLASGEVRTVEVRRAPPLQVRHDTRRQSEADVSYSVSIQRFVTSLDRRFAIESVRGPLGERHVLWRTDTGQPVASLPIVGTPAAVSRDGRHVMLMARERRVLFWDVQTGTITALSPALPMNSPMITDVPPLDVLPAIGQFSPGGDVAWFIDNSPPAVLVADVTSGRLLARFENTTSDWSADLLATGDDGYILAAGAWGRMRLWDMTTRRLVSTIRGEPGAALIEASGDGRRLLSVLPASSQSTLWDLERFALVNAVTLPRASPYEGVRYAVTRDVGRLVRWSAWRADALPRPPDFRALTAWETATGAEIAMDSAEALQRFARADRGAWVVVTQPQGSRQYTWLQPVNENGVDLTAGVSVLAPDGLHTLSAHGDDQTVLRLARGAQVIQEWHDFDAYNVRFSIGGHTFTTDDPTDDFRTSLFDTATGSRLQQMPRADGGLVAAGTPLGLLIRRDGTYVAWHAAEQRFGLYDLRTGYEVVDLGEGRPRDATPSLDQILVETGPRSLAVVTVPDGTFVPYSGEVRSEWAEMSARFIDERCRVAMTAGSSGMVLWDMNTGTPLIRLLPGDGAVGDGGAVREPFLIAILPSGHYAATPGGEARLRVTEGLTSYPIDAYRERFNRPDEVMAVLRGTSCRDGQGAQPAR